MTSHGLASGNVFALLRAGCPPGTFPTLGNGVVADASGLIPDVSLKSVADVEDRRAAPLLVVEVLSPSTAARDRGAKRAVYEARGVPSYWMVDVVEPSVLVLALGEHGTYVEVAEVRGDERLPVAQPFPVEICPADLVRLDA